MIGITGGAANSGPLTQCRPWLRRSIASTSPVPESAVALPPDQLAATDLAATDQAATNLVAGSERFRWQANLPALQRSLDDLGARRYNLGNGDGYTVMEVIDTARRVTGHPIPHVVGPRRAQDGATVWAVVRSLEAGGRMLAIAEYMHEHGAIRAMTDLNAAAAKAGRMAA